MADLSNAEAQYLAQEIRSESTLPLLSWLLRTEQDSEKSPTRIFHEVKAGVGIDTRPIPDDFPDESELVEAEMLNLINKGPGDGKPIQGSPKVVPSPEAMTHLM